MKVFFFFLFLTLLNLWDQVTHGICSGIFGYKVAHPTNCQPCMVKRKMLLNPISDDSFVYTSTITIMHGTGSSYTGCNSLWYYIVP